MANRTYNLDKQLEILDITLTPIRTKFGSRKEIIMWYWSMHKTLGLPIHIVNGISTYLKSDFIKIDLHKTIIAHF